jgi:RecA-family ATPase
VSLTAADTIKSGPVRWLWQGWVPLGALSVVAGEAGLGKSTLTGAHLTGSVTRGAVAGELHGKPHDVLIASAEDDWPAVIVPRLMAANADLERVHRVDVEDEHGAGMLTLPTDVKRLELALDGLKADGRPVAMIVIDPIGAFLSAETDSHKDASVRRALAPLAQLASARQLAVVVVAHLNKDDSQRIMTRVSGSVAFGAAARSVLGFVRDPDDADGEQGADRVLVHCKTNVGKYADPGRPHRVADGGHPRGTGRHRVPAHHRQVVAERR